MSPLDLLLPGGLHRTGRFQGHPHQGKPSLAHYSSYSQDVQALLVESETPSRRQALGSHLALGQLGALAAFPAIATDRVLESVREASPPQPGCQWGEPQPVQHGRGLPDCGTARRRVDRVTQGRPCVPQRWRDRTECRCAGALVREQVPIAAAVGVRPVLRWCRVLARSKGGALSPSLAAQETGARDQILEVVPFCLVPAALFGTQSGAELACTTHGIDYFRCCRTVLGMGWRVHGSVKPGMCQRGANPAVNLVA